MQKRRDFIAPHASMRPGPPQRVSPPLVTYDLFVRIDGGIPHERLQMPVVPLANLICDRMHVLNGDGGRHVQWSSCETEAHSALTFIRQSGARLWSMSKEEHAIRAPVLAGSRAGRVSFRLRAVRIGDEARLLAESRRRVGTGFRSALNARPAASQGSAPAGPNTRIFLLLGMPRVVPFCAAPVVLSHPALDIRARHLKGTLGPKAVYAPDCLVLRPVPAVLTAGEGSTEPGATDRLNLQLDFVTPSLGSDLPRIGARARLIEAV